MPESTRGRAPPITTGISISGSVAVDMGGILSNLVSPTPKRVATCAQPTTRDHSDEDETCQDRNSLPRDRGPTRAFDRLPRLPWSSHSRRRRQHPGRATTTSPYADLAG